MASRLEREIAAKYLEQAMDKGGAELVNALMYLGYCLSDAEVRGMAVELVAVLRGEL